MAMAEPDSNPTPPNHTPAPDATAAYQPKEPAEELVRVLDQYLADLEAGRAPSREKLLADHPDLASQLAPCLSGMEFIHRAARPAADTPARLGDFEIVGEVGRGGMGVVYEARQLSLKRKVALKVLRFAGVSDQDAMERFQREAETVAQLHHTNIVPIFAIGEQQGVFYYAMQFIEGRSLAAVLEASQKDAAPLGLVEVAGWALQAAEALAHAHQRNVIHRDVKPSNLILDPAGQVWLTDFGLAKRIDDVTLSMTGALMGTPRYMSPEQASATTKPVDQRSDIYSLGATLYELATGKPLFDADSAHGIISQILTTEPPPPRKVRIGLPRDLETIILKCLAKEPQSRYATAQALADDLRAFCEGRAIKARRAGLPERAARWVRKNRRMVTVAAGAAAVSVLLVVGGIVISSLYHQAQLAHVTLKTEGPNLVAEVLEADQDRPVLPSFTVPTAEPVALPAGSYRVRLSAPGRPAETSQLLVDSGIGPNLTVGLKQQVLWDPISLSSNDTARLVDLKPDCSAAHAAGVPRSAAPAEQAGWHVIRSQDGNTLSLLNGSTGQSVWQWSSTGDLAGRSLAFDPDQDPPELVQPAPDLDGDGVGDLVWACRRSAALWAISGAAKADKKGKELWWFSAGPGETLGLPAVADVDGDGTPDFIATFAAKGNVWIEAVSGKTGKSLWKAALERPWFQSAEHSRWAPQVVQLDGRPVVICVAGTRMVGLDLKTGKPLWPAVDLGMESIVRPHVAGLDRDGRPDLLLVGLEPDDTLSVLAFSLATRKPLWKKALQSDVSSCL
jgi:tRNA A-37 threonylcarbamoyl transferase component Bud32